MRFAPLALAVILGLVLFAGLSDTGLLDVREARDAAVARELIERREVLTPVYAGDPLWEKPTPAYALEVLARFAGSSPRRSRLQRALLATLLVLLTASIGARHFGARAGWLAAGVLGSSLALPLAARSDGTQLLATLLGWVGCDGLADAAFGRARGRELRLVVAWGALAAACVVAGPLPALWPLGGLALYAALARSRDAWRQARPLAGGAMILGAALPWYGALSERRGWAFLAHVASFPYGAGAHGSWLAAPAVALSFFVAGFFPWSAVLPSATLHAAAWWRGARGLLRIGARGPEIATGAVEREWREEGAAHLFVASLVAALIPMIVYPSPPLTAVLPALPAGALLCGRFLDHLFESPERVARPLARALPLLALSGTAGAVMLALIASRVPEAAAGVRLLATTLFVTSWLPLLAGLLGRRRLAAMLVALPVTACAPIATLHLLPQLEGVLSARGVAQAMNLVSPPASPLVVLDPEPPTLRWYLHRNVAHAAPLAADLRQWRSSDGETYLAFRPAREREVLRAAAAPLEILLRTETLVLARVRME